MAACGECGHDVTWAEDEESGERVPVDVQATEMSGDRFYFTSFEPPKVKKMSPNYSGYGYGDHRKTCPVVRAAGRR